MCTDISKMCIIGAPIGLIGIIGRDFVIIVSYHRLCKAWSKDPEKLLFPAQYTCGYFFQRGGIPVILSDHTDFKSVFNAPLLYRCQPVTAVISDESSAINIKSHITPH
jgi:hypothetical protein